LLPLSRACTIGFRHDPAHVDRIENVPYLAISSSFGTRVMSRSPFASTRSLASRRVAAAALLAFALAGQLANLAHLAVVHHEVCLEHGELMHSEEQGARRIASHADSALTTLRERESGATHDHDHCGIAAHRRESALRSAPIRQLLDPSTPAAIAQRGEEPIRSCGRDILSFAPKCSPPV
jgi:hypothetical protein